MLDAAKIGVCAVVDTYVVDLSACLDTALGGFRTLRGVRRVGIVLQQFDQVSSSALRKLRRPRSPQEQVLAPLLAICQPDHDVEVTRSLDESRKIAL
jgi:hypothetical protein